GSPRGGVVPGGSPPRLRRRARARPSAPVTMETKLHPPEPRPGCVPRPHLVRRLEAAKAKLGFLDAPVGYGKTTLLAEWQASEGEDRPFAWVSLDPEDRDPCRFWTYAVEAVRRRYPGFGEGILAALRTPGPDFAATILPWLVNELAALPRPL